MKIGNGRQENIELLRILCMFFILLFHFNLNAILRNGETSEGLNYTALLINCLVVVAVNVFVLISGYFSIKIKMKSVMGLLIQTEFYAVLAIIIYAIITMLCEEEPLRFGVIKGLVPFHPTGLWFIPCYAKLMILSPLLNWICKFKKTHVAALSATLVGGGNCLFNSRLPWLWCLEFCLAIFYWSLVLFVS